MIKNFGMVTYTLKFLVTTKPVVKYYKLIHDFTTLMQFTMHNAYGLYGCTYH